MQLLILVVWIAIILCFYASYTKLAAYFLKRARVSWKQSFKFAVVLLVAAVLGRMISNLVGLSLPIFLSVLIGLSLNLFLGGWFFSKRGTTAAGELLGWRGGGSRCRP